MAKDYYAILGLSKGASEQEIKQAYRKLSREMHPDKHKGDKQKEEQFKAVNEAYEVLSDPKKKQSYDQFGTADNPFGAGAGAGGGFGGGFDPSNMGDLGDIFESFFGGAGGRRGRKADTRGRDVEIELTVPFNDAVTGLDREMSFRTLVRCTTCDGNGNKAGSKLVTCPTCNGTGQTMRSSRSLFGTIQQAVICDNCRGSGKLPEKPCDTCNGDGRREDKKTVTIHVPAGIHDGQTLRVVGEGEAGRQGSGAGDLFVRIRLQPDERFVRENDDIQTSLNVPLLDAVLGGEASVETVQGKTTLTIPAGTQPGQVFRIKHKGMPVLNTSRFGDHYVTVNVEVPKKLSRHEKELYEQLRKQA